MMNEGLMIGKFAPLTNGHLTAFSMALAHCYKLNVLVCIDHLHDPECNMTSEQRIEAVRVECARISDRIEVSFIDCTAFPYEKESSREISRFWAPILMDKFPKVTTLFGSEDYVRFIAEEWPDCKGISYQILDKERKTTHISATMVRSNPRQYWDFIPASVKPFFTKNVLVLGAESCGKTTLTKALGKVFHAPVVPEMYRSIYPEKGMTFTAEDLGVVANVQTKAQGEANRSFFNKGLVLHDTCCEITLMYGREYFPNEYFALGPVENCIKKEVKFDLVLFCDIDVAWENDGTRTLGNEDDRKRMRDKAYSVAVQKAKRHGCELVVLPADYKRLPAAIDVIEKIL
ncbi:MAG: AAA family ATPase [Cetobacterium sp.]|uniref:AAA family ATPase n=1 Tax=Cetobacterium sp. TaxID=2071632 RepID=UPI003EE76B1B